MLANSCCNHIFALIFLLILSIAVSFEFSTLTAAGNIVDLKPDFEVGKDLKKNTTARL